MDCPGRRRLLSFPEGASRARIV
ncbi:hypothetical protein ACI1V7_26860 [Massilia sp. TN1-12]